MGYTLESYKKISCQYISLKELTLLYQHINNQGSMIEQVDSSIINLINILHISDQLFPLRNVIKSVVTHFECFAFLETPYIDMEYASGHVGAESYDIGLNSRATTCQRLHFFSGPEDNKEDLLNTCYDGLTQQNIHTKCGFEYRGYCVIRPTISFVVGRTAIEFDTRSTQSRSIKATYLDDEKGYPFLTVKGICSSHFLNTSFSIESSEFIQQDPNYGVCATASLWVIMQLLSKKCGTSILSYSNITKQGNHLSSFISSNDFDNYALSMDSGLTTKEILNVLIKAKAKPQVIYFIYNADAMSKYLIATQEAYSYIESGFPVLFCMDSENHVVESCTTSNNEYEEDIPSGHVVAGIGHLLPELSSINNLTDISTFYPTVSIQNKKHYLIGNAINLFYVHDDTYGPFSRIRIVLPSSAEEKVGKTCFMGKNIKRKCCKDDISNRSKLIQGVEVTLGGTSGQANLRLTHLITGIPPLVKLSSMQILPRAIQDFEDRYSQLLERDKLIFFWRTILAEGNSFKKSICSRNYHCDLKKWYAGLHFPKYIWIFEVSAHIKNDIKNAFSKEREIIGELLYDATSSSYDIRLISERVLNIYGSNTEGIKTISKASNDNGFIYPYYTNLA